MVLPLWRSLHSLNLMLPKEDRRAMLLRLFNEDTPLMDHSKDRFHKDVEAQTSASIKDEPNDVVYEGQEVDADIKGEMAAKEEEREEGTVETARLGEDVEKMGDGARDAESREDPLSDDALKDEEDNGA